MKSGLKQKVAVASLALSFALVGGTFAWQAFSQDALNESKGGIKEEAGGRLHDDFNGENKDVYVENYFDGATGVDIFARIRLSEYYEYDDGTGTGKVILRGDQQVQVADPDINDESTWDIYLYEYNDSSNTNSIRKYTDLLFGGSTVYMPTFNKDVNSLDADINGTYAEPAEILAGRTHYDDYKVYALGELKTDDARISYAYYEGQVDPLVENTHYYFEEETHQADTTLVSEVISMAEWISMGEPIGPYWVYDTDGWAYWADAIKPSTATGLLLDGIDYLEYPTEDWFYGIHVVSQIASAGDWGEGDVSTDAVAGSGIGMYEGGITQEALNLLNKVAQIDVTTGV